jgi:hypothetical protein
VSAVRLMRTSSPCQRTSERCADEGDQRLRRRIALSDGRDEDWRGKGLPAVVDCRALEGSGKACFKKF